MDACGVTNDHHVIIYGRAGCSFLPRVWFTFRHVMGHSSVSLMQGSLEDWKEAGGPVDSEPLLDTAIPKAKDLDLERPRTMQYQVQSYNENQVVIDLQEMKTIVAGADNTRKGSDSSGFIILDPRGSSFAKGHMPGAIHVPYSTLSDPHNPNRIKPVPELRQLLAGDSCGQQQQQPEGQIHCSFLWQRCVRLQSLPRLGGVRCYDRHPSRRVRWKLGRMEGAKRRTQGHATNRAIISQTTIVLRMNGTLTTSIRLYFGKVRYCKLRHRHLDR